MISNNASSSLAAASIYFLCLLSAAALARALWPYISARQTMPARSQRRRAFWLTICVATTGGALHAVPGVQHVLPDSWIGRGMYEFLLPQYVTEPGIAEPPSRDARLESLAALKAAILGRIESRSEIPESREAIDWVPDELWSVPGHPGAAYTYARLPDREGFVFEVSEPFRIDSELLSAVSEVAR